VQWQDEGIIVGYRSSGENNLILSIFTREHGKHLGLIKKNKKLALEKGKFVDCFWNSRLSEDLGFFKIEEKKSFINPISVSKSKLFIVQSICCLIDICLPERQSYNFFHAKTLDFFKGLPENNHDIKDYLIWEQILLQEMGFGLDISHCAITKNTQNLTHVSPKTGRAVCYEVAKPYLDKLLELPAFFIDKDKKVNTIYDSRDLDNASKLNAYFINKHLNIDLEKDCYYRSLILSL
jgi:DNA repair protein RecO (recombination protein O)